MLWSSLLIGLAGGMHCGLMCGPLHAAAFDKQKLNIALILYHCGRITTYTLIGITVYLFGKGISFMGFQQLFVYIISAYIFYFYVIPKKWRSNKWLEKIELIPFKVFGKLLNHKHHRNKITFRFFSGMLNGMLPCGLVYMAATNGLLASSIGMNILSMSIFGLSTVPWLLGSTLILQSPFKFVKIKTNKLKPYLAAVIICFLLMRTMDLSFLHQHNLQKTNTKSITSCGGNNETFSLE